MQLVEGVVEATSEPQQEVEQVQGPQQEGEVVVTLGWQGAGTVVCPVSSAKCGARGCVYIVTMVLTLLAALLLVAGSTSASLLTWVTPLPPTLTP